MRAGVQSGTSSENCPGTYRCLRLRSFAMAVQSMETALGRTELVYRPVVELSAPIVRCGRSQFGAVPVAVVAQFESRRSVHLKGRFTFVHALKVLRTGLTGLMGPAGPTLRARSRESCLSETFSGLQDFAGPHSGRKTKHPRSRDDVRKLKGVIPTILSFSFAGCVVSCAIRSKLSRLSWTKGEAIWYKTAHGRLFDRRLKRVGCG